jgi:glycosyltransferase involved in cell wall biosynthesis
MSAPERISIVIPMKNAIGYLDDLIKSLAGQKYGGERELVVVDSGSTDGTAERLKSLCGQHGIELNLIVIEPREFGHGKTRNLAVQNSQGSIVAILSQDALPASENWLVNLVKPLEDNTVAGVFGRQVPRPGTGLCEALFYELTYPLERRYITGADKSSFSNLSLFFSNVNGALRKSLALEYPFREDLVMSEDQFWGRAMLQQGHSIVYEPEAAALHSHNYSLMELFKRYFKSGYSLRQMGLHGEVMRGGAKTVFTLLREVLDMRPRYLPYALSYEMVQSAGFLLGKHNLLPSALRDKMLEW